MLHDVIRYGCRGVVSPQKEKNKQKKTYPSPDSRQHSESDFLLFMVWNLCRRLERVSSDCSKSWLKTLQSSVLVTSIYTGQMQNF